MKKLIVIGNGSYARMMKRYIELTDFGQTAAYAVESAFIQEQEMDGLPVVPIEQLKESHSPIEYSLIMGIGYTKMSKVRKENFERCKTLGFHFENYIHPTALIEKNVMLGEGNNILEGVILEEGVVLGNANLLFGGSLIAHETTVGDYNTFSVKAVAAGFIGRYVVDALLQEGYEVTALVRKKPKQFDDRVVAVEADICKEDIEQRTKGLVKKCGTLIHLAADLDMRGSDQTILTNCLGTYHVAGLAKAIGVKRFVYLSSIPVIGVPKDLPITELHPIEPKMLYHITKYAGEQIVRQELSESIQTVILRIPSPIGKGMNPNLYLSFLLRKCQKNETIELYGEGGKILRKRTNG